MQIVGGEPLLAVGNEAWGGGGSGGEAVPCASCVRAMGKKCRPKFMTAAG